MKDELFKEIDKQSEQLFEMADRIFDHPEIGGEEKMASKLLAGYLKQNGFSVEEGLAGLETAFRGVWQNGEGGPVIGLLCEYDALEGLGHGCGHHMQGPACLGAASAIKNIFRDKPYRLVVYGTPAEETFGGKINLMKEGYLKELDTALMMHGAPDTCTDMKCLALSSFDVTYRGKSSHAAIRPEEGRSAFDAMLLAFQGVEFLREHVKDDVRMHYTLRQLPGPENVVPEVSVGRFALRSFSREYLDQVIKRFMDVVRGAALMAGVDYEISEQPPLDNKVPVTALNDLLVENARAAGAPGLRPPRERTGSTDFGNVMHEIPGSCIRVKFVPEGTSSHSQAYVDAGKTKEAHECILYGAKAMAGAALDILQQDGLLDKIKEEFKKNREIYK
ncbi:amidohydrolase [Clostridium sp. chh4-2]|uniref:M20 family metallopeptidase n=1 Tax=Clostridium sp. chh4-2 TaxID=2067550 RepID=UPI000CCE3FFA|nr:M20 family metallopeptidase [Clostridium sp. chh4-2]PNV63583.1 amidohydrolase [Clostridium sp. chh4-2]